MNKMDHVEVIAEKERYACMGVHKGMQGWICDPDRVNGFWLIDFPQLGEKDDIAMISVKEELKWIPRMDARINEVIRAKHEGN